MRHVSAANWDTSDAVYERVVTTKKRYYSFNSTLAHAAYRAVEGHKQLIYYEKIYSFGEHVRHDVEPIGSTQHASVGG